MSATRPGGEDAERWAATLVEKTGGRLRDIRWFSSSMSRGGGHTAGAVFADEDGDHEVIIKLPVEQQEYDWTVRLGDAGGVTPRVFASGMDDDRRWLVIERIAGPCVAEETRKERVQSLVRASVEFDRLACALAKPTHPPHPPDWAACLERSRHVAKTQPIEDGQHWNKAIHHVEKALHSLAAMWAGRATTHWCHGDLHPGNAMCRSETDDSCVLIDLGLVHAGHWVEDALYLERLYWGHADALHGVKPVSVAARARRDAGLPTSDDYQEVANVKRLLEAASAPGYYPNEGNPGYFRHALGLVERLLPVLGH